MLMVSISGMTVSIKTDLWFPITGQQGHGSRNIHFTAAPAAVLHIGTVTVELFEDTPCGLLETILKAVRSC